MVLFALRSVGARNKQSFRAGSLKGTVAMTRYFAHSPAVSSVKKVPGVVGIYLRLVHPSVTATARFNANVECARKVVSLFWNKTA